MSAEKTKSFVEEVKETIVDDEQPLDKKAPGAPFVLVALSYLGILAVALLAIGFVAWLFT